MQLKYPNLFKPIVLAGNVFRNRLFGGPHYSGIPYVPPGNDSAIETLADEAKGGAAKVTVNDTMVDMKYGRQPWTPFGLDRGTAAYFSECAAVIKQYGAKAFVELDHAGQFAAVEHPIGPMELTRPDGVKVTAMDEKLMMHVINCFRDAAVLAKKIGFDGVMLHGGHGWLLQQFVSPLFNQRTDEYGGSEENRARFPKRVVQAMREAVGSGFVIEYRISGDERTSGGLTPEMTGRFLKEIEPYIDIVNISGGLECTPEGTVHTIPGIFQPRCYNVDAAALIKTMLSIPVGVVGAISDPAIAEEILASGKADCITMTRPLMADPELPNKARMGLDEDIVPCTKCLCCLGESESNPTFACSANPAFLRGYRLNHEYSAAPDHRKVLVIGGGFAGMKAAITAATRGHEVTLCEKSNYLGGILRFTDHDEVKSDLRRHKDYLIRQVSKQGVRVLLNTEITTENVVDYEADAVVIATGSVPVTPPIPGIDLPHVSHVLDLYQNRDTIGQRVVLIGGGLAGCETAVELARAGHHVVLLEGLKGFARDAHRMASLGLLDAIRHLPNLEYYDEQSVREITAEAVYAVGKTGIEHVYPADTVGYAVGMRPVQQLALELYDSAPYVALAGDCVRPRRSMEAIREGYFAAMNIR